MNFKDVFKRQCRMWKRGVLSLLDAWIKRKIFCSPKTACIVYGSVGFNGHAQEERHKQWLPSTGIQLDLLAVKLKCLPNSSRTPYDK